MTRFILIFTVFLMACGGTQKPANTQWEEGIYNLRTGEKVSESEFQAALNRATFVIVGESHDNEEDHARQAQIVSWSSGPTLVGMEMFQRPFQEPLDAFIAGEIDEAEMLKRTEWEDRWRFDPALYRPIWSIAKERGYKMVALNLRRELTKRISGVGISKMTEAEQAELPEHDLSDQAYRKFLDDIFTFHGDMDDAKLERFYQAQVMWDETMADSAVKASNDASNTRMILIVGRGHAERDWGIPSRIRRRTGTAFPDVVTVIPHRGDLPDMETLRRQNFADFLWVTKP